MKNPRDNPSLRTNRDAESLIEDYLDHFCAPLIGTVPGRERRNLRRELASHLEALAQEFEWQDMEPLEAVRAALREMGEPWAAGEAWLVSGTSGIRQRQRRRDWPAPP